MKDLEERENGKLILVTSTNPTPYGEGKTTVSIGLNDGLNKPRLINSRFSATGKNTYEIVDRKGSNDTNIYDQGTQFDVDTSLFKNVNKMI